VSRNRANPGFAAKPRQAADAMRESIKSEKVTKAKLNDEIDLVGIVKTFLILTAQFLKI
jgi:hypothetical protein